MVTFSRLKSLKIKTERTARLTLDSVVLGDGDAPVWLDLRFAGEANAAYWRDVLRTLEADRKRGGGGKISQANVEIGREQDVKLFAQHIVAGWGEVYQDDPANPGAVVPCPCTPANVETFLTSMLSYDGKDVFGEIKRYASYEDRYRDTDRLDGVDLGKR